MKNRETQNTSRESPTANVTAKMIDDVSADSLNDVSAPVIGLLATLLVASMNG